MKKGTIFFISFLTTWILIVIGITIRDIHKENQLYTKERPRVLVELTMKDITGDIIKDTILVANNYENFYISSYRCSYRLKVKYRYENNKAISEVLKFGIIDVTYREL